MIELEGSAKELWEEFVKGIERWPMVKEVSMSEVYNGYKDIKIMASINKRLDLSIEARYLRGNALQNLCFMVISTTNGRPTLMQQNRNESVASASDDFRRFMVEMNE